VPVRDYPRLEETGNYTFYTTPRFGGALHYFMFNMDHPAFQEVNVRRAFNHAVDREGIVAAVYADIGALPAYNFLPPHFAAAPENPESFGQMYDPALANQLLDEAGWVDSDGDGVRDRDGVALSFDVPIINWPDAQDLSQVLQANLEEIGVQITITPVEIPRLIELGGAGEFDIIHILWGWPYSDIMMNFAYPGGSFDWGGIQDEELMGLLDSAAAASTIEERDALFAAADQRLTEQAWFLPVVFPNDLIAVSNRVQDFTVNALGYHNFPTDWEIVEGE
jgi:peptide/nickel transport system substrate-binding protein